MKYFFIFLLLSSRLWANDINLLPDKVKTPGAVNTQLTKEILCNKSFRTSDYRHVPVSVKKKVFAEYGLPWMDRDKYEVDHLVSLELAGSNDITNLWPQAYEPQPGAREKDVVENYLHRRVCDNSLSLQEAQKEIAEDWYAVYRKIVGR